MRWAHNKRLCKDEVLRNTKAEITTMEDEHGRGYLTPEHKERLTSLVSQRDKILKDKEELWRL